MLRSSDMDRELSLRQARSMHVSTDAMNNLSDSFSTILSLSKGDLSTYAHQNDDLASPCMEMGDEKGVNSLLSDSEEPEYKHFGGTLIERASKLKEEIYKLQKQKAEAEKKLFTEQEQEQKKMGRRKRRLKRSYDPLTESEKELLKIEDKMVGMRIELLEILRKTLPYCVPAQTRQSIEQKAMERKERILRKSKIILARKVASPRDNLLNNNTTTGSPHNSTPNHTSNSIITTSSDALYASQTPPVPIPTKVSRVLPFERTVQACFMHNTLSTNGIFRVFMCIPCHSVPHSSYTCHFRNVGLKMLNSGRTSYLMSRYCLDQGRRQCLYPLLQRGEAPRSPAETLRDIPTRQ